MQRRTLTNDSANVFLVSVFFHFNATLLLFSLHFFSFFLLLFAVCFHVRNGPQYHFNLHLISWRKRRRWSRRRRQCFLSAHRIFHILHVYASVGYPLTSAVRCCLTFQCTISTAMHSVHCLSFSYCTDGRGSCASLQSVSINVKHDSPLFVYFAEIMPKKKVEN